MKGNLVLLIHRGVPPRVPRVRADPRDPPLADHDLERQLPLLLEDPHRSDPPPQPAMRAVTNQRNNAGPTTKENANSEIPVPETIHDREDRSLRRRRDRSSKNGNGTRRPDSPTPRSPRGKLPGVCRQWEKFGVCQIGPQNCKFQHPENRRGTSKGSGRGDDGAKKHDTRDRKSGGGGRDNHRDRRPSPRDSIGRR